MLIHSLHPWDTQLAPLGPCSMSCNELFGLNHRTEVRILSYEQISPRRQVGAVLASVRSTKNPFEGKHTRTLCSVRLSGDPT